MYSQPKPTEHKLPRTGSAVRTKPSCSNHPQKLSKKLSQIEQGAAWEELFRKTTVIEKIFINTIQDTGTALLQQLIKSEQH